MARAIAALFSSQAQAQKAIESLKAAGFAEDQIGAIVADQPHSTVEGATDAPGGLHVVKDLHTPVSATESHEATAAGGILGGTIGALLAATGALVIPGVGPFIAAGVFSTVAGGVIGALAGAFVGLGFTKEEAGYYEAQVHTGRPLVTVKADGRESEALTILHAAGGETDVPVGASAASQGI